MPPKSASKLPAKPAKPAVKPTSSEAAKRTSTTVARPETLPKQPQPPHTTGSDTESDLDDSDFSTVNDTSSDGTRGSTKSGSESNLSAFPTDSENDSEHHHEHERRGRTVATKKQKALMSEFAAFKVFQKAAAKKRKHKASKSRSSDSSASHDEPPHKKSRKKHKQPRHASSSSDSDSGSDESSTSSDLSVAGKGAVSNDPQELLRSQLDLERERANQATSAKIMNHTGLKKDAIRLQELHGATKMQRGLLSSTFNTLRAFRLRGTSSFRRSLDSSLRGMKITLESMKKSEQEMEGALLAIGSADIYSGSLAYDFLDLVDSSRLAIGNKKSYMEAVKTAQKSFKNVKDLNTATAAAFSDRGHGGRDGNGSKGGNGKGGKTGN